MSNVIPMKYHRLGSDIRREELAKHAREQITRLQRIGFLLMAAFAIGFGASLAFLARMVTG